MDGWFLLFSLGGASIGALVFLSAAADDLLMGQADLDHRIAIVEKRRTELAEQRDEAQRVANRGQSPKEPDAVPPVETTVQNAQAQTSPADD